MTSDAPLPQGISVALERAAEALSQHPRMRRLSGTWEAMGENERAGWIALADLVISTYEINR